ncbi:MAG: hypothetical protein JNJ85_15055 [Candidatus Kapabacteria bacterium]|nr:hypothetical protein [Candidatus Kapabacteria bacterium]
MTYQNGGFVTVEKRIPVLFLYPLFTWVVLILMLILYGCNTKTDQLEKEDSTSKQCIKPEIDTMYYKDSIVFGGACVGLGKTYSYTVSTTDPFVLLGEIVDTISKAKTQDELPILLENTELDILYPITTIHHESSFRKNILHYIDDIEKLRLILNSTNPNYDKTISHRRIKQLPKHFHSDKYLHYSLRQMVRMRLDEMES